MFQTTNQIISSPIFTFLHLPPASPAAPDDCAAPTKPDVRRSSAPRGVRINTPEEGDVYAPTMGELKVTFDNLCWDNPIFVGSMLLNFGEWNGFVELPTLVRCCWFLWANTVIMCTSKKSQLIIQQWLGFPTFYFALSG